MAGEKRAQDQEETLLSESVILVDIEGTTTSISFVKETLFPYVRENLKKYIATKWEDEEFKKDYEKLKEQAKKDEEEKVEGFVPISATNPEEEKESLLKNVLWQMDGDRKTGALKQLQGHMWREAYKSGAVKAHIYDDVPKAFESWVRDGKKIFVYSSGSVEAQKLLFGHSVHGDLLKNFSGFYDTEVGAKQDSSSYKNILSKIPTEASNVIFLTDVVKEAKAAKEAGLSTVIVVREGNAPLTDEDKVAYTTIKSFLDLTFQTSAKRQKLEIPADSKEDSEKSLSANVCEPMDTSEDVEMRDCSDRKEETRKTETNETAQATQEPSMANELTGAAGSTTTTATATTMTAGSALTTSTASTTSSSITTSSEGKAEAKDKTDETSGAKEEPMITDSSEEKQEKKNDSSSASTAQSTENSTDKVSERVGTESSSSAPAEKISATGTEPESAIQSSAKNKVTEERTAEKTAEVKEDDRTKQQQPGTEKLAAGCESMDITVTPEIKSKSEANDTDAVAGKKTENKSDESMKSVKNMETTADVPMAGVAEEGKVCTEPKASEDKMSCEKKSEVSDKQQHTKGDEQPAKAEEVSGGNSNGSVPSGTCVPDLTCKDDATMKPVAKGEPSKKTENDGAEVATTPVALAAASASATCMDTAKNGGIDMVSQENSTQSDTLPSDIAAALKDAEGAVTKSDEKGAAEKSAKSKEVSNVEKATLDGGDKKADDNDEKNVKKDESQVKAAGAKEKSGPDGNAVGTDTQQGCDISTVAAAAAAAAAAVAAEASSSKDSAKEETAVSVAAAAASKSTADEEKDTSKVADSETKKVNGTAQNGETTNTSGTTNNSGNSISNTNTTASTTTATATTTISSPITTATTTSSSGTSGSSNNNNNSSSSVPVSEEKLHRNGLNEGSADEKLDTAKVDDTSAQNGEPQSSSEASSAESIKVRKVVDSAVADGAGEPDVVPPVVVAATS